MSQGAAGMGNEARRGESELDHAALQRAPLHDVRAAIRSGRYRRHTAGLADGRLQCNLVILPQSLALDFLRFCQRNPKPCPLVGVSDTGDPRIPTLGRDIDIRSDVPRYSVYRDGVLTAEVDSIFDLWRDDFVAFAIGCSFTFERALAAAGIALRHIQQDSTVPMFRTTRQTVAAGPFGGGMVVSLRPIRRADLDRTVEICRRYPLAHGAPLHIGDPAELGIASIERPDWGDPVPIAADEVPVFWGCGVTPQNAVIRARPPVCITHSPGHMLITDVDEFAETPILETQGPR